jgi:hypothetical protein
MLFDHNSLLLLSIQVTPNCFCHYVVLTLDQLETTMIKGTLLHGVEVMV